MSRPVRVRVNRLVPRALMLACDTLHEALIVIDDRLVVRHMNAAARNLVVDVGGQPQPVVTCDGLLACGAQESPSGACDACWATRALRDGVTTPHFETTVGPKGARVWVEGSCTPLPQVPGLAVITLQPLPHSPLALPEPVPELAALDNPTRAVAAALAQAARELVRADYAALGRRVVGGTEIVWLAEAGCCSAAQAHRRGPAGSFVTQVLSGRGPLHVRSVPAEGAERQSILFAERLRTALAVPVQQGGEPAGVLLVGSRREVEWGHAAERVLAILAELSSVLLTNLDGVSTAQATSIRAEREWLAAELHDGLAQSLALLIQKLKLVRWAREDDAGCDRLQHLLQEVLELTEHADRDLRLALDELSASVEGGDFLPALQTCLTAFARRSHLQLRLAEYPENRPELSATMAQQVLRVIQEGLTNAHKHSSGSEVRVGWQVDNQQHIFTVADNGQGFVPGEAGQGFGLQIMAERARRIGGSLTVTTGPESGCLVRLTVPHPAQGGLNLESDSDTAG